MLTKILVITGVSAAVVIAMFVCGKLIEGKGNDEKRNDEVKGSYS